jgi:hypothetical protein
MHCQSCELLYIGQDWIERIDLGEQIVDYGGQYWENEAAAALDRARGSSLARAAEAILYCRRPIERFIDISAGDGKLLDELTERLPSSAHLFHATEPFPPTVRTQNPNYFAEPLEALEGSFDAGVCIEVIEHLTPAMLSTMVAGLAARSAPDSLFLFNTGLADYTRKEDPNYLDPFGRGHIVSYSWPALRKIFEPHGFTLHRLGDREWAFAAEYKASPYEGVIEDRIWTAPNASILKDPSTGSVLFLLGLESARAYRR